MQFRCDGVEDRKSRNEKYDADVEKYISDTLVEMRLHYCALPNG